MAKALMAVAAALLLAGPLLHGLTGAPSPNAFVFAPLMLAGLVALLAGGKLRPDLRLLAQGLLICGVFAVGLWYLGAQLTPVILSAAVPVGCAIAGALLAVAANMLRVRA